MRWPEFAEGSKQSDLGKSRDRSFRNPFPAIPETAIETKQKSNTPSIFLSIDFIIANPSINIHRHRRQQSSGSQIHTCREFFMESLCTDFLRFKPSEIPSPPCPIKPLLHLFQIETFVVSCKRFKTTQKNDNINRFFLKSSTTQGFQTCSTF